MRKRLRCLTRSTFVGLLFCVFGGLAHPDTANSENRPELALQVGHRGSVYAVACSSDGKKVATGGEDRSVYLWSIETGDLLRTLTGFDGFVKSLCFSPNGTTVRASVVELNFKADNINVVGKVYIWDAHSGALVRTVNQPAQGDWSETWLSSDGQIASTVNYTANPQRKTRGLTIWDIDSGEILYKLDASGEDITNMASSPDQEVVAMGCRLYTKGGYWTSQVKLWRPHDSKPMRSLPVMDGMLGSIAFSPDDTLVAIAVTKESSVQAPRQIHGERVFTDVGCEISLWEVSTGTLTRTFTAEPAGVNEATFSPDGRLLAAACKDGTAKVWDVKTGNLLKSLKTDSSQVFAVAFSPDGRVLATGGLGGNTILWDVGPGTLRHVLAGNTVSVRSLAFSPDGKVLATPIGFDRGQIDSDEVRVWDLHEGSVQKILASPRGTSLMSLAYSASDGTLAMACGGGKVGVWDKDGWKELRVLDRLPYSRSFHGADLRSLSISPDGRKLAAGGGFMILREGKLTICDYPSGRFLKKFSGHSQKVTSVSFSPDGTTLASGSADKTTRIWNVQTGASLHVLPSRHGEVLAVAFSPDGKEVVSSYADGSVDLWDAESGKLRRMIAAHTGRATSVAFSPDGTTLASSGEDHTVRLWDPATGALKETLKGHSGGGVKLVTYSPDERLIASLGNDGEVKLWNASTGTLLVSMRALPSKKDAPGEWLVFTPDGYYAGSDGAERFIRWRVGEAMYPAARYREVYRRPDRVQAALK